MCLRWGSTGDVRVSRGCAGCSSGSSVVKGCWCRWWLVVEDGGDGDGEERRVRGWGLLVCAGTLAGKRLLRELSTFYYSLRWYLSASRYVTWT